MEPGAEKGSTASQSCSTVNTAVWDLKSSRHNDCGGFSSVKICRMDFMTTSSGKITIQATREAMPSAAKSKTKQYSLRKIVPGMLLYSGFSHESIWNFPRVRFCHIIRWSKQHSIISENYISYVGWEGINRLCKLAQIHLSVTMVASASLPQFIPIATWKIHQLKGKETLNR